MFCFLILFLYKTIFFVLCEIILVCSEIPDEPLDFLFFNELANAFLPVIVNRMGNEISMPDWIRNNAGWWATDKINDSSFLQGIQYLIKEKIMIIPQTEKSSSTDTAQLVPVWVKNNAGWWAKGEIDDKTFVSGIQYLIKVGIIKVS